MSSKDDFVVFSNQGEIDIAAVTTLGVSVKPGANPIGFFGTGLKYSIAILLREKQEIFISSGLKSYRFFLREQRIRGEMFEIVHMQESEAMNHGDIYLQKEPVSLHFTTGFGRNWTLANVYRELWSNMQDEKGSVYLHLAEHSNPEPKEGTTQIIVRGNDFCAVHERRYDFLLSPRRTKIGTSASGNLEIYAGQSNKVFFRGIAALKLDKPSRFTYNIVGNHRLTEDRTLECGTYFLDQMVKQWVLYDAPAESVLDSITTNSEVFHEGTFHYSSLGGAGETFKKVVKKATEDNVENLNQTACEVFFSHEKHAKLDYTKRELTEGEQQTLDSALEQVKRWGFDYQRFGFYVTVVDFAGRSIIARVNGKSECVLTHRALDDPDLLAHALIEEFVHMRDDVHDATLAMQNVLFREIVRLGRERDLHANDIPTEHEPEREIYTGIDDYSEIGAAPLDDEIPF